MTKENHNNPFRYRILLIILAIITVGLIVGIVATVSIKQNDSGQDNIPDDLSLPEELEGDNLPPEDQVLKEVTIMLQTPGTTVEDVKNYYDGVIDKANEEGNRGFAINIIQQKLIYMVVEEEDCLGAKDYADNIDISIYSEEELEHLRSSILSVMLDCKTQLEEEDV